MYGFGTSRRNLHILSKWMWTSKGLNFAAIWWPQRMMDDVWKWHKKNIETTTEVKQTFNHFYININIMIHFSCVTLPSCVKKNGCNPFSNRHGITPNGTQNFICREETQSHEPTKGSSTSPYPEGGLGIHGTIIIIWYSIGSMGLVYLLTLTMNINYMYYIPYMDPMGYGNGSLE